MEISDFDREWEQQAEEVLSGMKEWRIQHPRVTLNEMETALDERLNRMRARMLEDMALASRAANSLCANISETTLLKNLG